MSVESTPEGWSGTEGYDLIIGSELCYLQEHCVLADVLAQLLISSPHKARDSPPGREAIEVVATSLPLRLPQPAAVIVQRSDRLGWAPFLARCGELRLDVDLVPVHEIQKEVEAAMSHGATSAKWDPGLDPAYVLCVIKAPAPPVN